MQKICSDLFQLLVKRKSVRDFTEQQVEPEKVQKIYEAILSSPTTENMMMYSVIRITDKTVCEQLSKQPAIRKAPLVLVFCADYRRWARIFNVVRPEGRKPEEGEYQLALIDTVIAAQNAVIAAEALGLNSVYLGDIMEHYEDRVRVLRLPAGVIPVCTLCIGYGTSQQLERPKPRRYLQQYLIHEGQYHDPSGAELLEMLRERGQYQTLQDMQPWLEKFSARATDGKGAVERTRSIRVALKALETVSF